MAAIQGVEMQTSKARVNQVSGAGAAKVTTDLRGLKECKGYLIADNLGQAMLLADCEQVEYSGPVYDGAKVTQLTFPVFISRVQGNRVEFSATANPYAGVSAQQA